MNTSSAFLIGIDTGGEVDIEEDIDLTEMETFDMLLETTKNRVLSDT